MNDEPNECCRSFSMSDVLFVAMPFLALLADNSTIRICIEVIVCQTNRSRLLFSFSFIIFFLSKMEEKSYTAG